MYRAKEVSYSLPRKVAVIPGLAMLVYFNWTCYLAPAVSKTNARFAAARPTFHNHHNKRFARYLLAKRTIMLPTSYFVILVLELAKQ